MEHNKIDRLLNKYLEGESTLEEEALLRNFFSQPSLPSEYSEMQEMFRYFAQADLEVSPSFHITNELTTLIDNEWKKENKNRFRQRLAWISNVAAVLVISFGMFHYLNKPEEVIKDTYNDPQQAYMETKRALLLISKTMNKNTAPLTYLTKVDESFNHMKKIAEIDRVVNSVKNSKQ